MNPFLTNITGFGGQRLQAMDVTDRLRMVVDFGPEECRAALKVADLQKTVRVAIERRLRKLEKAA